MDLLDKIISTIEGKRTNIGQIYLTCRQRTQSLSTEQRPKLLMHRKLSSLTHIRTSAIFNSLVHNMIYVM